MIDCLLDEAGAKTIPIWPVSKHDYKDWLARQPAPVALWSESAGFEPVANRTLLVPGDDGSLAGVIVGLGAEGEAGLDDPLTFAALAKEIPPGDYRIDATLDDRAATNAALGWALGCYDFGRYREPGDDKRPARLVAPSNGRQDYARRAAQATYLVRDLINTPAADMGPAELAAAAEDLGKAHGAQCSVITGKTLERDFPAIHAVGSGSIRAPRLVDLCWGDEGAPRITLVGKGVCFDSGGLDIKPAAAMRLMKKDMGGAAHVLGVAQMIMDAGLAVRLRVLVPAVENSISGHAYRPGDVIRTGKGTSVEIGNTDAEGRLVLADALALADDDEPRLLVDFATLTGAARVALGPELPALFTADETVADDLARLAREHADPLWRLPLWEPYAEGLKSKIADINNIADTSFGGAITAALFLKHFVPKTTAWAHLDIFGWVAKARPGQPAGGEAMGLRAIYALIEERAAGS